MPQMKFHDYWLLRVKSATTQLDAAKRIIQHGVTRGTMAENALRSLLQNLLPVRHGIAGGFILDTANHSSRQVDILIYDRLHSAPIYQDETCTVVSPDMAVLAIESKSRLTIQHLRKALENIASVKAYNPRTTGIVFAFNGMRFDTLQKHLIEELPKVNENSRPDFIMNLQGDYVVTLDQSNRSAMSCTQDRGLVVKTLFLQTILAAEIDNLVAYLNEGPEPKEVWREVIP
jgi:hypothetical protein